jgi:hypothetical protein
MEAGTKKQKTALILENGKPVFGRNAAGKPVCNSPKRGKPTTDRCQDAIVMANGRCRRHGGKSPVGIGSARFKHGYYSKDFVTHLLGVVNLVRQGGGVVETMDDWVRATRGAR